MTKMVSVSEEIMQRTLSLVSVADFNMGDRLQKTLWHARTQTCTHAPTHPHSCRACAHRHNSKIHILLQQEQKTAVWTRLEKRQYTTQNTKCACYGFQEQKDQQSMHRPISHSKVQYSYTCPFHFNTVQNPPKEIVFPVISKVEIGLQRNAQKKIFSKLQHVRCHPKAGVQLIVRLQISL